MVRADLVDCNNFVLRSTRRMRCKCHVAGWNTILHHLFSIRIRIILFQFDHATLIVMIHPLFVLQFLYEMHHILTYFHCKFPNWQTAYGVCCISSGLWSEERRMEGYKSNWNYFRDMIRRKFELEVLPIQFLEGMIKSWFPFLFSIRSIFLPLLFPTH